MKHERVKIKCGWPTLTAFELTRTEHWSYKKENKVKKRREKVPHARDLTV